MPLTVTPRTEKVNHSKKRTCLSNGNFLHFYDFAVAIHGTSMKPGTTVGGILEHQLSTP